MEIVFRQVSFRYASRPDDMPPDDVLSQVDLVVPKGAFCAILGETGAGKSTLIQLINGLLLPSRGEVLVGPFRIDSQTHSLKGLRQKVGLLFQYPEHQLFANTVEQDVAFALKREKLSLSQQRERVQESLQRVGLSYEQYAKRSPFSLSGGEKRRVALAGILVLRPEVLVLDEPTAGLDGQGKKQVLDLVQQLNRGYGVTVVMVTHDVEEAVQYANQVAVLSRGRVLQCGVPREVLTNGQVLAASGLQAPRAYRLARKLNTRLRPPLPERVIDGEELIALLVERWRGRSPCVSDRE